MSQKALQETMTAPRGSGGDPPEHRESKLDQTFNSA
jgi:hypothetical protein